MKQRKKIVVSLRRYPSHGQFNSQLKFKVSNGKRRIDGIIKYDANCSGIAKGPATPSPFATSNVLSLTAASKSNPTVENKCAREHTFRVLFSLSLSPCVHIYLNITFISFWFFRFLLSAAAFGYSSPRAGRSSS